MTLEELKAKYGVTTTPRTRKAEYTAKVVQEEQIDGHRYVVYNVGLPEKEVKRTMDERLRRVMRHIYGRGNFTWQGCNKREDGTYDVVVMAEGGAE